jgi:hypothetical protein
MNRGGMVAETTENGAAVASGASIVSPQGTTAFPTASPCTETLHHIVAIIERDSKLSTANRRRACWRFMRLPSHEPVICWSL